MNTKWFKEYLLAHTPDIAWDNAKQNIAVDLLSEIAKANGGEILTDIDISTEEQRQFVIQRLDDAIGRRFNEYASTVREQTPYFVYNQPLHNGNNAAVAMHEWRPKLELNSASIEELEALPAIGPVLAQRISEHRNQHGSFKAVTQLEAVKGIDDGVIAQTMDRVFIMPDTFKAQYHSAALKKFVDGPHLSTFTNLVVSGGEFSLETQKFIDPLDRLIAELTSIRQELKQRRFFAYEHLPMTRSSRIQEIDDIDKNFMDPETGAVNDDDAVAGLLFDENYFTFTLELLRSAKHSIKIIMFYMRYDKRGETSLSDQLVEEVLAAKNRGVDIQVILDRDRQGDVFKSRLINNNAFKALKASGVDVVYDESSKLTHTKLVLVDDLNVILGSHNWTSGSLSAYDDTSLYIKSKSLSQNYNSDFNDRFNQLNGQRA